MERHIIVVDPLPNVANGVKKTLSTLAGQGLSLFFEPVPGTLGELRTSLRTLARTGKACGLVMPLNSTSQTPVLASFRQETHQLRADTFDLMALVRQEWSTQLKPEAFPILVPFLSLESPESVLLRLRSNPSLTHVLGCLTSHILGITAAIGKSEAINVELLHAAFRQFFTQPDRGPWLIRDYVKHIAASQTGEK